MHSNNATTFLLPKTCEKKDWSTKFSSKHVIHHIMKET